MRIKEKIYTLLSSKLVKFWDFRCLIPTIWTMLQIQPCVACLLPSMNNHVCRWPLFTTHICLNIYVGSRVKFCAYVCLCRGCSECFWSSVQLLNPDFEVRNMERKSTSSSASAKDLEDWWRTEGDVLFSFHVLNPTERGAERFQYMCSEVFVCRARGRRANIKIKSISCLIHCDVQKFSCLFPFIFDPLLV